MNVGVIALRANMVRNIKAFPWYDKYRIKGIQREEELKKVNEILKRKLDKMDDNK